MYAEGNTSGIFSGFCLFIKETLRLKHTICASLFYKLLSLLIFYTKDVLKTACAVISFILSSISSNFEQNLEYVEAFQQNSPCKIAQKTVQQFLSCYM